MPSSPVHLLLAYTMADSLNVKNKADFLLGAIAPDCVNYGTEQASEEVRYKAHIRDRDYDISGNFVGRIKGAKCPFDLQFLTWDFS